MLQFSTTSEHFKISLLKMIASELSDCDGLQSFHFHPKYLPDHIHFFHTLVRYSNLRGSNLNKIMLVVICLKQKYFSLEV